ncbi:MADS-box protein FLOWERING LOCUS C-like [Salvia miltiorrhiza]|uniref:MADS-box protein FLOWERING LOCUS C-like n=1 Tax=Salvia miltiorrhiza TaxID=226208 RepID=UPI0025AC5C6C|nr:MADS-box protein FLOWERING LOCUS C-like [Salvia miltiorrhiza]
MGRRKLEIKRIEDNNARQMSFTKRRNGLLKKAKELAVLCDVDVAAIVVSSRGKLYQYSSNNNLTEILQRHQNQVEIESASNGVVETQEHNNKYADALSNTELLQIVDKELGGDQCGEQLSVIDLINLEKQFQEALIQTRSTKTHLLLDSISSLHEKEKMLGEEKKGLEEKIAESNTSGRRDKMTLDLNFLAECHIMD